MFQAEVFAWWAAHAVGGVAPGLGLDPQVRVDAVGCETGFPADDVGVALSGGGFILVQAKSGMRRLIAEALDFRMALNQMVRTMIYGFHAGVPLRPVDVFRDRLVIATSSDSSRSFDALGKVCTRFRDLPLSVPVEAAAVNEIERKSLKVLFHVVRSAWMEAADRLPTVKELRDFFRVLEIRRFDFEPDVGADLIRAGMMLQCASVPQPFSVLARIGMETARYRSWRQRHALMSAVGVGADRGLRPLMMPRLDGPVVARQEPAERLAALLTADPAPSGAATIVGVYGTGGFGKTTLAAEVCQRPGLVSAFPGGVLWVTAGDNISGSALSGKINDLSEILCGDRPLLSDPELAGYRLGELLDERERTLLVLDDIWSADQVTPFLKGAPQCVRLITTRVRDVLPADALAIPVDQMNWDEGRELITAGLPEMPEPMIRKLLRLTGRWPLLLSLVNGAVRQHVRDGADIFVAAAEIARQLGQDGPDALDLSSAGRRDKAVHATLAASLDYLEVDQRQRFLELAIFPEDADIPIEMAEMLWAATGGFNGTQTRRLRRILANLSLLSNTSTGKTLRLHDVVRAYLRAVLGSAAVTDTNRRFVDAARKRLPFSTADRIGCTAWWTLGDAEYLWRRLAYHLHDAGLGQELSTTVCDLRWIDAKLRRLCDRLGPDSVIADLDFTDGDTARELRRGLERSIHLLGPIQPEHALSAILISRLDGVKQLQPLVQAFSRTLESPMLVNRWPLQDQSPALARVIQSPGIDTETVRGFPVQMSRPRGLWFTGQEVWAAIAHDDGSVQVWNMTAGELSFTLTGHSAAVREVVISPNRKWIASAADDHTVRLWGAAAGQLLATLEGHAAPVAAVAITADGTWLASLDKEGTIRTWDATTGEPWNTMKVPKNTLRNPLKTYKLSIAPDGRWLASASGENVHIWDVATGQISATLEAGIKEARNIAISPDGSWLAAAGLHHPGLIWDIASGESRRVHDYYSYDSRSVAISPDGNWFAIGGWDNGIIQIFDAPAGRLQVGLQGHNNTPDYITISSDSQSIASIELDGTIRVWDLTMLRTQAQAQAHARAYKRELQTIAISPDGKLAVTGGVDGGILTWNTGSGKSCDSKDAYSWGVNAVAYSPDGKWIACADTEKIIVWDAVTGDLRNAMHGDSIAVALAISPDLSCVASAVRDGTIRIWGISDGNLRATLRGLVGIATTPRTHIDDLLPDRPYEDPAVRRLDAVPRHIWAVLDATDDAVDGTNIKNSEKHAHGRRHPECQVISLRGVSKDSLSEDATLIQPSKDNYLSGPHTSSPDGRLVAHIDRRIQLLDNETGQLKNLGTDSGASNIAFFPSGNNLVSTAGETVTVWDIRNGQPITILECNSSVQGLAVSSDGAWLAFGDGRKVQIWDIAKCRSLASLDGNGSSVWAIAISPDGTWLASGENDSTIRIWDIDRYKIRSILTGHDEAIRDIAISSDGNCLASVSLDRTLRVWNTVDGTCLTAMRVDGLPTSCAWLPNRRELAVTADSGLYMFTYIINSEDFGKTVRQATACSEYLRRM